MAEYTKRLHVPLTDAQHRAIKLLAGRTGQPIAYIAREAIMAEVKTELRRFANTTEPKE